MLSVDQFLDSSLIQSGGGEVGKNLIIYPDPSLNPNLNQGE